MLYLQNASEEKVYPRALVLLSYFVLYVLFICIFLQFVDAHEYAQSVRSTTSLFFIFLQFLSVHL